MSFQQLLKAFALVRNIFGVWRVRSVRIPIASRMRSTSSSGLSVIASDKLNLKTSARDQ